MKYSFDKSTARPWFFQAKYLVVCFFCVGTQFLHGYGQSRILGALMVGTALLLQFNRRTSVVMKPAPAELKFYTCWGAWAILTGFIVAKIPSWVWWNGKMFFQMLILLWGGYALFVRQKNFSYFFWILILIGLVHVVCVQLGFQYDSSAGTQIGGEIVAVDVDMGRTRASGLTGNSNMMGFVLLASVWACIMLWKVEGNRVLNTFRRGLLIGLVVLFSYYTIQTGSRKSILNIAVLVGGWLLWLIPGKLSIRSVVVALIMAFVVALAVGPIVGFVMEDTFAGVRFRQWFDAGGGSATEGFKENIRYAMYVDGFKFWLTHPIAGIGLGHFGVLHWSGLYSHSDYIESLACTGIVGFILYQGFACSIVVRIVKLLHHRIPADVAYHLKGMLLFVICNHFLIGLGAPHWCSIDHELTMVFIGTCSWRMWNAFVKGRNLYAT